MAERRDCKDFVSIFVCSDWQLLRVRLADGAGAARVLGAPWGPGGCAEERDFTSSRRGAACASGDARRLGVCRARGARVESCRAGKRDPFSLFL